MCQVIEYLTDTERSRLEELEGIVEKGQWTFVEVGDALYEIREKRLYRETHITFEEYCNARWSMSKTHANRLISSTEVVQTLTPMGVIQPQNERQIRPLTKLETPELQQEAWHKAVENAGDEKLTARHVQKAVSEIKKEEVKRKVKKVESRPLIGWEQEEKEKTDIEFYKAWEEFYGYVCSNVMSEWGYASKDYSLHLINLLRLVTECQEG